MERIFVVGHAAVTCLGRDMDSTWLGLIEGRSGIRRHPALSSESFLQDLGGRVEDFGPGSSWEDPAVSKFSARFLHLAMASARAAWSDAGLDRRESDLDPHRSAVVVGSAFGGLDLLETEQARMTKRREPGDQPLPGSGHDHQSGRGADRPASQALWTGRGPGERLRLGRPRRGPGWDVPEIGRGRSGPVRGRRRVRSRRRSSTDSRR